MAERRNPQDELYYEDGTYEDENTQTNPGSGIPYAPPNGGGTSSPPNSVNGYGAFTVDHPGQYGNYTQMDAIQNAPAGDPEYNARQKIFEGQTNWGSIEQELRDAAAAAGLDYHSSDLEGIRRNAGYDASHQGASGGYISALNKYLANAKENYTQRANNTPGSGGDGGGGGGGGTQLRNPYGTTSGGGDNWRGEIQDVLRGLFPGGGLNEDLINRRTDLARSDLNRYKKSTTASNQAALAARGLMSEGVGHESGPDIQSGRMLDENISETFANAVSGIYANESENADQRMMQALQLATGMSENDAQLAVAQFRAETDRTLGLGNLALGNMNGINSYNLGLGQLGLQRDLGLNAMDNSKIDQLMSLIQTLVNSGNTLTGGSR